MRGGSRRDHDPIEAELRAFLEASVRLRRRAEAPGQTDLSERGEPVSTGVP